MEKERMRSRLPEHGGGDFITSVLYSILINPNQSNFPDSVLLQMAKSGLKTKYWLIQYTEIFGLKDWVQHWPWVRSPVSCGWVKQRALTSNVFEISQIKFHNLQINQTKCLGFVKWSNKWRKSSNTCLLGALIPALVLAEGLCEVDVGKASRRPRYESSL